MNYLLFIGSIILGIIVKAYDEIVDNNLKINKYYIIALQFSMIFLSFYLYFNDALFMLICTLGYYCAYIYDYILLNNKASNTTQLAMNDTFWHFYAILLVPMIIFNYNNILNINIDIIKIIILFLVIITVFTICLIEAYFFPEENSSIKILIRCLFILFNIIILSFTLYFNSYFYNCISLYISFWIGYITTFVIFKQYIIPGSNIHISDTLIYIWKKLKNKNLQKKLKRKRENKVKKDQNIITE